MSEHREEVLYIVAVRAPVEADGRLNSTVVLSEIKKALNSSIPLRSEDITIGAAAARYEALTANHNGYLRELGFNFDMANRLITVAREESS